jgi:hypothetical protein
MENISYQGKEFWALRFNWDRLENFTHKLACAIHFKHYGQHLNIETATVMRAGMSMDGDFDDTARLFKSFEESKQLWQGENPDIFKYQILGEGMIPSTLRFLFYKDVDILVCPLGNPDWIIDRTKPLYR